MISMPRLLAAVVLAAALLAGCGEKGWHGKDVSAIWPPLAFELTDENGEQVTQDIFAGGPLAIYLGLTNSPDIRPATLARLPAAARSLPEPMRDELQMALVSIDPDRDTPDRLADYTRAFSDRLLGLTGTQKQLTAVTRRYRISYGYDEPRADGSYDVSHSSSVLVFGPDLKAQLMLLDSQIGRASCREELSVQVTR